MVPHSRPEEASDGPLRDAFLFGPADLAANRQGRLSPRQEALLRASSVAARVGLGVFVVVILASLAAVLLSMARSTPAAQAAGSAWSSTAAIAVAAVLGVIVVGFLVSRRYMGTLRSRRIAVASGTASIASDDVEHHRAAIAIGGTRLRVSTAEQLLAFEPGRAYRVYYLEGPVPVILSAEATGKGWSSEAAADEAGAAAPAEGTDPRVRAARRAWMVPVAIGVMALAVAIGGVLATDLLARMGFWGVLAFALVGVAFAAAMIAWARR